MELVLKITCPRDVSVLILAVTYLRELFLAGLLALGSSWSSTASAKSVAASCADESGVAVLVAVVL